MSQTNSSQRLRVAVLMGGTSSERTVSLITGKMVASSLDPNKYDVTVIDTRDFTAIPAQNAPTLLGTVEDTAIANTENSTQSLALLSNKNSRPDVVFIALHGKGGEDGSIQGLLETLGVPYTGSGVLASALAMDKVMAKRVYQSAGIPIIDGISIVKKENSSWNAEEVYYDAKRKIEQSFGFPVFVKPSAGGSTCGCTLVTDPDKLAEAMALAHEHDATVIVERYVRGVETTCGILDTGGPLLALPVIEIVPKSEYYDFESKYADGGSEHLIPARLSPELTLQIQETAKRCHTILGCKGVSRTDMIVVGEDYYVLETNTIPGMTPTSLLPQSAAVAGISFSELLDRLIQSALN